MPYNPGVQDISGQLLAQGINGAVNGIAQNQKAIYASKDELEKELAHINGTVSFARQQGILTPEDMDTYITGNITKKRELAVKAGMGYEAMLKQQQMQMQQTQVQQGQQRIDLQAREMDRKAGYRPTQAELDDALKAGKTYLNTSDGFKLVDTAQPDAQYSPSAEIIAQKSAEGYGWFPQGRNGGTWIKTTEDKKTYQPGSYILDPAGNKQGFVDDVGTPRMFETMSVNDPTNVMNVKVVDKRTGKAVSEKPEVSGGSVAGAQATQQAPTGKVRVIRKSDGVSGWIPAASLQDALKNGYRQ